jgi:hypothetical protein
VSPFANRLVVGDFEEWATEANSAIEAFANAAKTQMVADIGPHRAEWKWGTRGCVATPTPDGKSVSVLFENHVELHMPLIGAPSAATEDGQRIAERLLLGFP